jgi:DNA-binding transcriptional LysR family regulator
MDFVQIEHFIAVCDEGTFTRAAERVFRTQSAVSQSIKKLEEEIGTRLLSRGVHDVTPTDSGKIILDYARRMVRLRDDSARQVEALKNLDAGSLAIGAHEAAAMYLLPVPLKNYLQAFPDIKIGIYRRRLDEIPSQVLDRQLDVGFVKEEPVFHGLEVVEVHSDEMILVGPKDHPLAKRKGVGIRDLGQESFVLHHHCTATLQRISKLFEQYSTPCRIVAELWSFENVKSFACEGVGLAILPRVTALSELQDKRLVEIPVQEMNIPRRTLMIYRDQGDLSEPARQLINLVRKYNQRSDGPRLVRHARTKSARPQSNLA